MSEIREGYKKTEAGIIPVDWDVDSLENICVKKGLVRGPFGGALKKSFFVEKGYKVYEQKNAIYKTVKSGTYYINPEKYLELKRFAVVAGDFIVSCSGTIGRIFQIPEEHEEGVINQALLKITVEPKIIHDQFFYQYFEYDRFQNKIIDSTQGGAMKNLVGMSIIKKTKFPLPSIDEQKQIAEILSSTDEHIEKLDQLIAEYELLKKGMMQKLLTEGIGHTEFKDSKVGRIPEAWEVKKLGDLVELGTGFPFKSKEFKVGHGKYKLLRGINISEGFLRWNPDIDKYWDDEFDKVNEYLVKKGDLVISMDGSKVGKNYALIKKEHCSLLLVQRVALIRSREELVQEYLCQVIASNYFVKYVDAVKTSSGIPHISAKQIKDFRVAVPSIEEQKIISDVLNRIINRIEKLIDDKKDFVLLKEALMEQLLTGKVRVI